MRFAAILASALAFLVLPGAATTANVPRASQAVWSPDGKTLAFVEQTPDGRTDVYTIGVDGSRLLNVTGGDARTLAGSSEPVTHAEPVWSSEGRLAYVTGVDLRWGAWKYEYWVSTADGRETKLVAQDSRAQMPSWSPDGTELTFEGFESVVTARVADGFTRTLAGQADSSLWSPRDRRIAFSAIRTGTRNGSDVFTMRPDGTHLHRLTTARGADWPVAWSRDARRIAFVSQRPLFASRNHDADGLYVMDSDGRSQRRVGTAVWGDVVDFSPRGDEVVHAFKGNVYLVGADGRHARVLVRDASEPRWSPDGRWIAFTSEGTIQLVHPDGTGRHTLAP